MTLHENWKTILRETWSVRWWALAVICDALGQALQYLFGTLRVPPQAFAGASVLLGLAGLLARVLAQPPRPPHLPLRHRLKAFWHSSSGAVRRSRLIAAGGVTALGVFLVGYTGQWESGAKVYHYPYRDVGGVLTVCQGHTGPDVVAGRYYSAADCDALELADLQIAEDRFLNCVRMPDAVPDPSYAAFVDWTFNVGQHCSSTVIRKLNAGDLRGACMGLSAWIYVHGQVFQGLVNRRVKGDGAQISEQALCLQGLAP